MCLYVPYLSSLSIHTAFPLSTFLSSFNPHVTYIFMSVYPFPSPVFLLSLFAVPLPTYPFSIHICPYAPSSSPLSSFLPFSSGLPLSIISHSSNPSLACPLFVSAFPFTLVLPSVSCPSPRQYVSFLPPVPSLSASPFCLPPRQYPSLFSLPSPLYLLLPSLSPSLLSPSLLPRQYPSPFSLMSPLYSYLSLLSPSQPSRGILHLIKSFM